MLDVSENTLWNLIRAGEVRVSRHGNLTLAHIDSLREFLAAHTGREADTRGPRRKERAAHRHAVTTAPGAAE